MAAVDQPGRAATAPPVAMTRSQAEDFLYREARLLDEGRFDEWRALTTEDVIYWVPINDDDADPTRHISIIYDDTMQLEARVWRIAESGLNHSQDPPSKTVRFVTNVEVEPAGDADEAQVYCNLLLCEFRPGQQRRQMSVPHWYACRCRYRLRRVGDDWRIAFKKVSLLDMDGILNAMTFMI
jgi:3-phenylpropionate/cinnamic acid dioxygenase small subunit